jgi:uncharacterized protein RhaS with RHS repeats
LFFEIGLHQIDQDREGSLAFYPAGFSWYLNDHLGTPQRMLDGSGRVVWAATYDSFGNARIDIGEVTNNLRLPGQYFDAETGLHYNRYRYYSPSPFKVVLPVSP